MWDIFLHYFINVKEYGVYHFISVMGNVDVMGVLTQKDTYADI